ncbi:MAG: peptidoglycan DD-metalloendopeptidase family protein [Candidatus Moraniibacteriota bacterium]|nr:MAG: peptidoglycan DD-metalloendopeptidase family protein [Candidatus Moranbacteria bacterium]
MRKKYTQKFFNKTFIFVLFLACFQGGMISFVQAEETITEKLDDANEELKGLNEKKESYSKILNLKIKQEQIVSSQVKSLQNQVDTVEKNIQENEEAANRLGREAESLIQDIQRKELLITVQKIALSSLMRDYYDKKKSGFSGALLANASGESIFSSQDRTSQLQERVIKILEEIKVTKVTLEEEKKELDSKKIDLENVVTRLEKQGVYLEGATQEKEKILQETKQEKGKYAWRLNNVEEKIKEIEQEIAAIEAAKINGLDLSSMPFAKKGLLSYPVKSPRITQSYGKTTFTRWYTFHNGVDFGASTGTPVYSVADGKVIADGDSGNFAYGKWIAIEHEIDGKKLVTIYGHLSKKRVGKGASLKENDQIGSVGSTGYSTGPHLHFGVYSASQFEISTVNGEKIPTGAHVNPMKYLE